MTPENNMRTYFLFLAVLLCLTSSFSRADDKDNVIIKSAHGYYRVNLDILNWNEHDLLSANWSDTSNNISEKLRIAIFNEYRGKGLTIERVLLDMHSGRVVGKWGTYFMDLVAILMLVISATGIWMWLKRR